MIINLLEYFLKTTLENPDKIAIIDREVSIKFIDLYQKSKSIGWVLQDKLGQFNRPVAVYLPKCINSIVADLSITFSGNCYMNLDVKTPLSRISNIIEVIKPSGIITNKSNFEQVRELVNNIPVFIIEELSLESESVYGNFEELVDEKPCLIIDTDPYCIINTSGSTGTPKGVVLNHRSFIDFTEWAVRELAIRDNEIVGSLSPIVFDIYSFELCMLMAKGSTIVLIPDQFSAFPASILQLIEEKHVSFIFWVPTIMVNIANNDLLRKIPLKSLKTIWFAGEVFPTKQFNYWRTILSDSLFVNLYGPIEITLDCTYYIADKVLPDEQPLPIGFPCKNTDIIILDEMNNPVRINEEGELCVRGTSLAMGYYNNPEKTALAFVQNPLNSSYPEIIYRTGDIVYRSEEGLIHFKGRKDTLIKHLGYRIELGEIEHILVNTIKIVENACVVYNKNSKEITLFYESATEIPAADFRKAMLTVLPKYMLPSVYKQLPLLPRNTNGKIDRLALNKLINE